MHLGTRGSQTDELIAYLSSVEPKKLILNGDIVDIGQFGKGYFPRGHIKVLRKIFSMASKGTEVFYISGNHDEAFRRFNNISLGNIHFVDKLVLDLDGEKAWFFHGDVFDNFLKGGRWLTKFGSYGYDMLLLMNRFKNWWHIKRGKELYSLSKKIKNGGKEVVKIARNFERSCIEMAIEKGFEFVICGHIHQPKKEMHITKWGKCTYLNSGDWVENLTALEYSFRRWKVYRYNQDKLSPFFADEDLKEMNVHQLIASISYKESQKQSNSSID